MVTRTEQLPEEQVLARRVRLVQPVADVGVGVVEHLADEFRRDGGVFGLARAVVGFTTKRWLDISVRLTTTARFVLVIAFVVLWIYQQGNAEFVMNARP